MKNSIVKNTAIYGIGNIAQNLLSFVLVFFYTHYLSVADVGLINTLQVFSSIYSLFLSFGLERSLYRLYHDYESEEEKKVFLGTVTIAILLVSIMVVLLTLVFQKQLSSLFDNVRFYPFLILSIFNSFLSVLTIAPKLLFQIRGKAIIFLFITLGQALVNFLCIFLIFKIGNGSVTMVLWGGVISYLVFLPVNIFIIIKHSTLKIDFKILKNVFSYSLPLLPSLLSTWIINMSDRLFLQHYYSLKEVGLYSVVYKMGQIVQLFSNALLMAYNPLFYSLANKKEVDKPALLKLHQQNILALLFLYGIVALIGNDFISIFLNKNYQSVSYILPIVVMGYFFVAMISLQNLSLHQTKKTGLLMQMCIIAGVINIVLNYLFIIPYGINGAAIATLLTQMVFFGILYKVSIKHYFLRINFWQVALCVAVFGLMVFFSYRYIAASWMGLIGKLLLVSIVTFTLFHKTIFRIAKEFKLKGN